MDTGTAVRPDTSLDSQRLLLPYLVGLITLCAAMQVLITITGNRIGTTATLTLAIVAIYYWGYVFRYRDKLRRIRFAQLVAHAVTYVVVNGSFQLHAAVLAMINNDNLRGDDHFPIDSGWFGPTLAMAGFWAIGFTIHALAAIGQRGFES